MRFALALLLVARAPPAPAPADSSDAPPTQAAAVNPDFAALPTETDAGQWTFDADEGVFAAGFGGPESEYLLTVVCRQGDGAVIVRSDHELAPDQHTTLTVVTEGTTLDLPAHSFNEGLPSVDTDLPAGSEHHRAVAEALSAPQTRFGVRVGQDVRVYPWSAELARALHGCR